MSASSGPSPLRVAVAGLGTVGAGTVRILQEQAALVAARAGRPIEIRAVSARTREAERGVEIGGYDWVDNCVDLAARDDVDVIVELIGGPDGTAKALVEAALARGRHVVTANKALLAHHGTALARAAEGAGVGLFYEGAVAGGVPVIKGLREGLAANSISRIVAILNGTCNFILGLMEEKGAEFEDALRAAQDAGFAEADPSTDIGGFDAAHKLVILASIAFGTQVDVGAVATQGIEAVTRADIANARELGYRIKLLAVAARRDGGLVQRVEPALVPIESPLAHVAGPGNAVQITGDPVGVVDFNGPGAGQGPTASAVVADLIDIARGVRLPVFGVPAHALAKPLPAIDDEPAPHYLRFTVPDQTGVIATIAGLLADHDISIETMIQRPDARHRPGESIPVIMVTYPVGTGAICQAMDGFAALDILLEPPQILRVEAV